MDEVPPSLFLFKRGGVSVRVFCVSCCDFKGVWVLPETVELTRLVTTSSPVDAHTHTHRHARVRSRAAAPCAPERWEVEPPSFTTPRRERAQHRFSAVQRSDQRSRHVFPRHRDRDASEAAAQREERGWLCVLFRPRAQLVLSGAVRSCVFARVCMCGRRTVRTSLEGLFTMTLGII